jgi:hypothetical protein
MTDDRAAGAFVDARFSCSRCGREAAHLTLFPRGSVDSVSPAPDLFAGWGHRLAIEAGTLSMTIGSSQVDPAAIAGAIGAADIRALYALNREYAPVWCPTCEAIFCADEWRTWDVYADDFPGFFEEKRGVCPNGHERWIYD